ncbi:MAG: hypothetical protein M1834_000357 [Cirrosporium novae-zelandiae]|nr:MAG: hypothetical protein M1834_000357 [Cirrosporium novae-zelandiae]
MGHDPLSPVSPARLKVLLVPAGNIKHTRFSSFISRLKPHDVVRLGDVSPDKENRNMFSPLAFPTGTILFDLCTSIPQTSYQDLSPFELFRDPLAIIGIADAQEIGAYDHTDQIPDGYEEDENSSPFSAQVRQLSFQVEDLQSQFPKALLHHILLFDHDLAGENITAPEGVILVPSVESCTTTTMKTVMCDLTSLLLIEMTVFANDIQLLPTLESPKDYSNKGGANGHVSRYRSASSLSRRNSHATLGDQQNPPDPEYVDIERIRHRMSMPVHLPSVSNNLSRSSSRTISPPSGRQTPPITFNEIAEGLSGAPLENIVTRSSAGAASRSGSRDRMSVQVLGSGNTNEKTKTKGKGRIGVVMGALYLLAGRWPDAVKELVDSAVVAKASHDYLWHAKALESILVCLLMLGWAGIDFHIPQVCYPTNEKNKSGQNTPSGSNIDVSSGRIAAANRLVSLQNLTNLLPDLMNMILNLYERAEISGEGIPQLAYSEVVLRFARLLTAIQRFNGKIDDDVLHHVISESQYPSNAQLAISRTRDIPSLSEIAAMVFRAFPSTGETELNISDHVTILAGMASILSDLGFERKKAIVLRELVALLIPGLVEARKVGAAEMGVHPAAGLMALGALQGNSSNSALDIEGSGLDGGIKGLLDILGQIYGTIRCPDVTMVMNHITNGSDIQPQQQEESKGYPPDSMEGIVARVLRNRRLWYFGNLNLKVDILKSSINLCEALPDLQGVLQFTVDLLQTAAGAILQAAPLDSSSKLLRPEDQVRLLNNLRRTVSAGYQLGVTGLQAEFWDEFIVRNVEFQELPYLKRLAAHEKTDLELVAALDEKKEKNPFIHNPFLRAGNTVTTDPVLVEGEVADFRVTLRNFLDFEIEIEELSLESEGVQLEALGTGIKVGPRRTQSTVIAATPKSSGTVAITGCIIKVRDCRKRRFSIFKDIWKFRPDVKMKWIGLAAAQPHTGRPISTSSNPRRSRAFIPQEGPMASKFNFQVIGAQPVAIVESTSLSQASLMILEGESTTFDVILRNVSLTTPIDFFLVSFQDSSSMQLEVALSEKDLLPSEIYELEWQLYMRQSLAWRQDEKDSHSVGPGRSTKLQINVFGKPGLSTAKVFIDYGRLGKHKSQVEETFYTRRVEIPITVTVNASVEVVRNDVLPFAGNFTWAYQKTPPALDNGSASPLSGDRRAYSVSGIESLLRRVDLNTPGSDHCLLLVDLRNVWPYPLRVALQVCEAVPGPKSSNNEHTHDPWNHAFTVSELLQPGHTTRVVLPLPRLFVKSPHAPIPSLNPSSRRQFVLSSTNKISPAAERTVREAFWFREEALKHIRGTWSEQHGGRTGSIDLRGLRLTPRMVEAIRLDELEIGFSLSSSSPPSSPDPSNPNNDLIPQAHQAGPSRYIVKPDSFYLLTARIRNRSGGPVHPLLRLLPSLRHQPSPTALDLARRFAFTGALQRALPVLGPGEETSIEMGVCALCKGEFEIGALAEEIRVMSEDERKRDERASTGMYGGVGEEVMKGSRERRLWIARDPCVIIASEETALGPLPES